MGCADEVIRCKLLSVSDGSLIIATGHSKFEVLGFERKQNLRTLANRQ